MFNSRGLKAPWTISWTDLLRLQTSDNSSIGIIRLFIDAPDAASDKACKNLDLSTSVTALDGIKEMASFAHSNAFKPYARVIAISVYVT